MQNKLYSLSRFLITTLVSACILLSSTVFASVNPATPATPTSNNATIGSVTAQTDCRLSSTPDDCYRQQSQQQWKPYNPSLTSVLPPLNTKTLGIESPFSAELKYDTYLSWILGVNYFKMFNEKFGIAAKATGGFNEWRGNLTTGYAFTSDHQLKLTYEYLTQNLPFQFASGGIDSWVAQQALGAAYQYNILHEVVHSLELSAYAIRANSKDLSSLVFNQVQTAAGGYTYDTNYRRIAGGSENTAMASVNLLPFANDRTTLVLGGGYSNVSYDTIYENNNANSTVAYKAELGHLISSKLKLAASFNATAAAQQASVSVNHILPKSIEGTVLAQNTKGSGALPSYNSVVVSMAYPAPESYVLGGFGGTQDFKNWIDKPVIYADRVLAIKDEAIQSFSFGPLEIPDDYKLQGQTIVPVTTQEAFAFTDPTLNLSYVVYTAKLAGPGSKKASATTSRDYTKDLDLALTSTGANQAILQSAEPIPDLDADGVTTQGLYQVTITATGLANGASPMLVNSAYELTVENLDAPIWDVDAVLAAANMGSFYPPTGTAEQDMTAQVTPGGSDTSVTLAVSDASTTCNPPSWLLLEPCTGNANHQCVTSNDGEVPNDTNTATFCVDLIATGVPSGETAVQTFTPNINQFAPTWLASIPTQTIDVVDDPTLKIYLNSSESLQVITANTQGLAFQQGAGFDTTHWTLGTDEIGGPFIQLIQPVPDDFRGLVNVPLTASNQTSYGVTAVHNVPVNIVAAGGTQPKWVGSTLSGSLGGGTTFSQDLNELGDLALVTTEGLPTDTYAFTIVSASRGNWTIDATNKGLLTGTGLSAGTVQIVLEAQSTISQNRAIDGTFVPPYQQQITLTLTGTTQQMAFVVDPAGSIKFDATDDADTWPIPNTSADEAAGNGINLNKLLTQETLDNFENITFTWVGGTAPAHYQIKQNAAGDYYLLRAKTGNTVYAGDVSSTPVVVGTDIHAAGTPVGGGAPQSVNSPVSVTILPDANIRYVYASSPPAAFVLTAATSDGNGNPNPNIAQTETGAPPSNPYTLPTIPTTSVYTNAAQTTQVLSPGTVAYLVRSEAPAQNYLVPNNPTTTTSIQFYAPTTQEYAALIQTPNNGYVNAKSVANGNGTLSLPAGGNIINLQPITGGSLILVPNQEANTINTGFNPNNLGPNMSVGTNNVVEGSCFLPSDHRTVTALAVNLPAVTGKTYSLTRFQAAVVNSTLNPGLTGTICVGAIQPIQTPGSDLGACPYTTWNAANLVTTNNTSSPRCNGNSTDIPNPTGFTGAIPLPSGNVTIFADAGNMNGGADGPPPDNDIPSTYGNFLSRGTGSTAPILGLNYNQYPRVKLQ